MRRLEVTKLTAEIGGKKYELVPAETCKGCAFERKCYRVDRPAICPEFNGYPLSSVIDVIFKEIK